METGREILRMEQICTVSMGTTILDNAKLNLLEGEVVGLVGVNYSGKTTLAGAFTGHFPCTSGRIIYREEPVRIASIMQARREGIFYIQPTSALVPVLTVAENIFLTPERDRGVRIRRKESNRRARELLDRLGLDIPETEVVSGISGYARVVVEICKALLGDARIIVLDNVISALPADGLEAFRGVMKVLEELSVSLLIIEARLRHLKPLCRRIFVIREGRTVGVAGREGYDDDRIIALMIGHPVGETDDIFTETRAQARETLLELRDVCYRGILRGVGFSIYRGEILGVLNVSKNSGRALEKLLSGQDRPDGGELRIAGEAVAFSGVEDAARQGIAIVPEDDALVDSFTLGENILLSALKNNSVSGILKQSELRYVEEELISTYIRRLKDGLYSDDAVPYGWLYQKKVAFCRALAASPRLMVLSNPTQRIDFMTRQVIYEDIVSLKEAGVTALLISTNINELVAVCERIVVVQNGRVTESFPVEERLRDKILMKYGTWIRDI